MLNVTVKTLDSQNHSFSVSDEITVKEFKDEIAPVLNIAADKQRLIFCGKVLKDDKKLSEYDVNGKVIHVVQSLPPQQGNNNSSSSSNGPSTNNTTTGNTRSTRDAAGFLLGAFTIPQDLVDPTQVQNIVQDIVSEMGDIGRNATVMSRASDDGSVDVHINLGRVPVQVPLQSEAQLRMNRVRNMLSRADILLVSLEDGANSNNENVADSSSQTEIDADEVPSSSTMETETPNSNSADETPNNSETRNGSEESTLNEDTVINAQITVSDTSEIILTHESARLEGLAQAAQAVLSAAFATAVAATGNAATSDISTTPATSTAGATTPSDSEPMDATPSGSSEPEFFSPVNPTPDPTVIAMDTLPSDSDPPVPEPSQQEVVVTTPDPSDQNNHHPDCPLSTTRTPPTNGTSSTTSSRRTPALMQPSVQTLANLLDEVIRVNTRLQPCLERCRDLIRSDPALSGRQLGDAHHLFSRVSQLMHFLSHAYHSLSDLHINFRQPPPRSPRVRIISSTHSSSLFQGIPMQAQFSLTSDIIRPFPSVTTAANIPNNDTTRNSAPETRPVPITRIQTPIITSVSSVSNSSNPLFVQRTHNPVVLMEVSPTLTMNSISSLASPASASANGPSVVLPTPASDSTLPRIQIPTSTATASTTARENIPPPQSNDAQTDNQSNPPRSTASGTTSSGSSQGPPPINIPFRNLIPVPLTSMGSLHTFDSGLPCHSVWALEPSRRRHNAGNPRTPPNAQGTVNPNNPGRQEDHINQIVGSIMSSLLNHVPSQGNPVPTGFTVFTSRADDSTTNTSNSSTNQATRERTSRAQSSEHSYANRPRRSSAYESAISLFNNLDITEMKVIDFLATINVTLNGILGDFVNHLGTILTMKDMVDIAHGMNEPVNKIRKPGRDYLKTTVFKCENPDQNSIKSVVQQIVKESENALKIFAKCVKLRDRRYTEVLVTLFHRTLCNIFGIFLSDSESDSDFSTHLVDEIQKFLCEFMHLNDRFTHDANSIIEAKARDFIKHLAPGDSAFMAKVRPWLLAMLKKLMRKFSPVNLNDGKARAHGSESTASRIKGPGATQKKPNTAKPSISIPARTPRGNSGMRRRNFVEALGVNEALASGISRNRSTPTLAAFARIAEQTSAILRNNTQQNGSSARNLTEVVLESDAWHNSVPQDWVPIITRDVQRQRRQAAQAPFSNAYLSGMPSKRRRIMNGNPTLLAPSKGALPEMLLQAISSAKVNPVTDMELLKNEAMKDVTLQSSFHKHMKNSIQERLQRDLDYCSERFPNSEKYFN
ncbi:large proline-rich protein BAG6 [Trichonephila clavata]|uniref:BCL2-associated athanogene 6 n=1 Tax=Trichonephila clavata TaxID=2740835 RepID=A0A8X6KTL5_TRICU|nr:large proline-rich protein BAG6 [Trichonephila clavata]